MGPIIIIIFLRTKSKQGEYPTSSTFAKATDGLRKGYYFRLISIKGNKKSTHQVYDLGRWPRCGVRRGLNDKNNKDIAGGQETTSAHQRFKRSEEHTSELQSQFH